MTNKSIYVTPKELAGVFAMWAVRQSPYLVPDNLHGAIFEFTSAFDFKQPILEWKYPLEFNQAVLDAIMHSKTIVAWNERKNGNRSAIGVVTRYGQPEPDDDFIDLHALQMNICRTIFEDQENGK
jgi:hypothetical protein